MYQWDEKAKFAAVREVMIRETLVTRGISDAAVIEAVRQVPREEFVPQQYHPQAYADGPLPIGMGQTISQPYIVALMTQALRITSADNVLEIGTGSGYQTAILAKLAKKVYTIERFEQLSESAQAVLGRLGINNVDFLTGDGSTGWPEQKKFNGIIITAAVPKPPESLIEQLADEGRLVAPVGGEFTQSLVAFQKKQDKLENTFLCDCRFVKLIGQQGFSQ